MTDEGTRMSCQRGLVSAGTALPLFSLAPHRSGAAGRAAEPGATMAGPVSCNKSLVASSLVVSGPSHPLALTAQVCRRSSSS